MTQNSELRVGVAGLGKMGLLHASVLNSLEGSRVVAAADPSPLMGNAIGEINQSIKTFQSVEEMLEKVPMDALVIATPVATHVPIALDCVRRKIPFLMEKPLATSADQASDLVAALEKSPTPHMIGFMTRFIDTFVKGKEILASGALGNLQRVASSIYVSQLFTKGKGWRYDRKVSGGGVLSAQGSHLLDLLTWYFGPVKRVNAEVLPVYSAEIEDFAHLMFEFKSGVKGHMDNSWSVRHKRTVETTIDVLGDNGSLVVSDDTVKLFLDKPAGGYQAGWTSFSAVDLYRGVEVDIGGPQYTREDKVFIDAIRSGKSPQPDIYQALHVQKIVDAAYRSSDRGGAPEVIA